MRRFFLCAVPAVIVGLMPMWAFGSDQETAQKVAAALRSSGRLQDYSIGVKFENGKAQLLGRVASEEQAQAAVEMAESLDYVTEVENRLEVKPSPKRDFAVQPTAHTAGQAQSRDDAMFGATPPRVPKLSPEATQASAQAEPAPLQQRGQPHGQANGRQMNYDAACMEGRHTGRPIPVGVPAGNVAQRVAYDRPNMPCYAWPSYASHPNYAGVTYPNQYSASAWPYIGPFYPYPQVPLGWRRVTMEWKDGWWWLDFNDHARTFRR